MTTPPNEQPQDAANQCDGCRRGLPKNVSGNHCEGGLPVMGCTAHLYADEAHVAVGHTVRDEKAHILAVCPRDSDARLIAAALNKWFAPPPAQQAPHTAEDKTR
jgi:hypothetical protein